VREGAFRRAGTVLYALWCDCVWLRGYALLKTAWFSSVHFRCEMKWHVKVGLSIRESD
jgi:hypothetical protein